VERPGGANPRGISESAGRRGAVRGPAAGNRARLLPGARSHRTGRTHCGDSRKKAVDSGPERAYFYKDEKSLRRGKPKGLHGIKVRWEILDHPPESIKELTQSDFDTNPPLTLIFDEKERGKHVYMSGSWEIEREGKKGPPGPIIEAVIP
jgi:hypothetical protein